MTPLARRLAKLEGVPNTQEAAYWRELLAKVAAAGRPKPKAEAARLAWLAKSLKKVRADE